MILAVGRQPASCGNEEMAVGVGNQQGVDLAQSSTSPAAPATALEIVSWRLQTRRLLDSRFPTDAGFVGHPRALPQIAFLKRTIGKGPCVFSD